MSSILVLCLILVVVFILLGMNVSISFLVPAILFEVLSGGSISGFARTAFSANNSYSLLAIPLFMLGGMLMEKSGIAGALVELCEIILRKIEGGMASIVPVASMMFGMLTGSAVATVSTIASITIPRLERLGYDKRYTGALAAASAPLGYMIPPNMNAIIFSLVSTASVADLFIATVIPGFIWLAGYVVLSRFVYQKYYQPGRELTLSEGNAVTADYVNRDIDKWKVVRTAIPAFIMPVIIIGGIYSGTFTPTEAGGVSALYALVVGLFVYKQFRAKGTLQIFTSTSTSLGTLMIIFPFAMIFSKILVVQQVPAMMMDAVNSFTDNKIVILILIDVILIVTGLILDAPVLTLVIAPIMMPTVTMIGVSPVQFGVIIFVAIGIGACTPPLAITLFVASKIGKMNLRDMLPPLWPFLFGVAIPVLVLVTFVPALSEFLPNLVNSYK